MQIVNFFFFFDNQVTKKNSFFGSSKKDSLRDTRKGITRGIFSFKKKEE